MVGELFKNTVEISGLPPDPDSIGPSDSEAQPSYKPPRDAMVRLDRHITDKRMRDR